MNRNEIIKIITNLNMNKNDYRIISGAAMVLYGIKEGTPDIDLAVVPKLYKKFLNKYDCEFEVEVKNTKVYFMMNKMVNFGLTHFDKDYKVVDGLAVQTIDNLIKLKQELNRPKDLEDIKKINNYINK